MNSLEEISIRPRDQAEGEVGGQPVKATPGIQPSSSQPEDGQEPEMLHLIEYPVMIQPQGKQTLSFPGLRGLYPTRCLLKLSKPPNLQSKLKTLLQELSNLQDQ